MKSYIATFLFLILSQTGFGQYNIAAGWLITTYGPDFESNTTMSMVPGGLVFAGNNGLNSYLMGSYLFSMSGVNACYAKCGLSGNLLWCQHLIGNGQVRITQTTTDPVGNVWISGTFYCDTVYIPNGQTIVNQGFSNSFLLHIDQTDGSILNLLEFPTTSDLYIQGVTADPDGNLYIHGYSSGAFSIGDSLILPALPGFQFRNFFLAKLTATGQVLWHKTYGNAEWSALTLIDEIEPVIALHYGNHGDLIAENMVIPVYDTCATAWIKYDFQGNAAWEQHLPVICDANAQMTSDRHGNLFALTEMLRDSISLSSGILISNGSTDHVVLKIDSTGNLVFAKNFGGQLQEITGGSIFSKRDHIYLAATLHSPVNYYENLAIPGYSSPSTRALFLFSLDSLLSLESYASLFPEGGCGSVSGFTLCADDMRLYVAGNFTGIIDFYNNNNPATYQSSSTTTDAYLIGVNQSIITEIPKTCDPGLLAYPNPFSDIISLNTRYPGIVTIYDMTGRELVHTNFSGSDKLDLSYLYPGCYILHYQNYDSTYSLKLIKK